MLGKRLKRLFKRKPREAVYRPPRRKVSLSDLVDFLAITYMGKYADKLVKAFDMENQLAQAGIKTYPMLYMARALFYTVTSLALSLYFILVVGVSPLPLAAKAIFIIILLLTPVFVFAAFLAYPAAKREERKSGVETELPFFAAYLTTMARAGVSIARVIERVSDLRIFDAMRREAKEILASIRLMGRSPLDAVEENALTHPSPLYRDFMLGYATSVKTGGDVLHYLEIRTQDIFTSRMNQMKLIAERMSMFTEVYVTVSVIMTLVFYIFFTIKAIIPVGGQAGGVAQIALFSFVFLPMLTFLLLWLIHSSQPKSPIKYNAPYAALIFIGFPSALVVFPILFYATGAVGLLRGEEISYSKIMGFALSLGASLIALSLPSTVIYLRYVRKTRGLSDAVASFLRDLTEVRKTGLSPEKSILVVTARDYGPLNPITKRLHVALTLGLDLEKAVRRALRGYKDWLLLANFRFLVDSISVGGGSPETLESIARYAYNLTELDKEFRKRLRSYIMMPYMGAILVAASSILVLSFTAKSIFLSGGGGPAGGLKGGGITPEDMARVALLLSLGAILNSYLMGIVAGKIQDGRVAAGFLHGILLVLITIVTVAITLKGVPLGEQAAQAAQAKLAQALAFLAGSPQLPPWGLP